MPDGIEFRDGDFDVLVGCNCATCENRRERRATRGTVQPPAPGINDIFPFPPLPEEPPRPVNHCPRCGRDENHTRQLCESCGRCESDEGPTCCRCEVCPRCEAQCNNGRMSYCRDCERCGNCCQCDDVEADENDGQRHATIARRDVIFYQAPTFRKNPSKRYLAAEIEVWTAREGTGIDRACERWGASVVEDGSLQSQGFEINTSPANGDIFLQQIADITDALNSQRAEVNERCGLHIHLDARDYKAPDMKRLLRLYAKLEPAIFWLVPKTRRFNQYCQPCSDAYMSYVSPQALGEKPTPIKTREALALAVYQRKNVTKRMRAQKYGGERYRALNLVSWYHRGTVEIRLFNGTTNFQKITAWAMLWADILDYAKRKDDAAIDALPNYDNADPLFLLKQIVRTVPVLNFVNQRFAQYGQKEKAQTEKGA